jgi:hypothetical protein
MAKLDPKVDKSMLAKIWEFCATRGQTKLNKSQVATFLGPVIPRTQRTPFARPLDAAPASSTHVGRTFDANICFKLPSRGEVDGVSDTNCVSNSIFASQIAHLGPERSCAHFGLRAALSMLLNEQLMIFGCNCYTSGFAFVLGANTHVQACVASTAGAGP